MLRLDWASACWLLLFVLIATDGGLARFVGATAQLLHLSPLLPLLGEWGGGDGADVHCPERSESGTPRPSGASAWAGKLPHRHRVKKLSPFCLLGHRMQTVDEYLKSHLFGRVR